MACARLAQSDGRLSGGSAPHGPAGFLAEASGTIAPTITRSAMTAATRTSARATAPSGNITWNSVSPAVAPMFMAANPHPSTARESGVP